MTHDSRGSCRHTKRLARAVAGAMLVAVATLDADAAHAGPAHAPTLTVELGGAWQARNDARIDNEAPNTPFAIDEITGSGPYPAGRVAFEWSLAAPLRVDDTGISDPTIVFRDTVFDSGRVRALHWRF